MERRDHSMADSPTLGTVGPAYVARPDRLSMLQGHRPKAVNFSRPVAARPTSVVYFPREPETEPDQAYHKPEPSLQPWPEEPRFSLDSDPGTNQTLGRSGRVNLMPSQELAWDVELGEMVSRRRGPVRIEEQRHPGLRIRKDSSTSTCTRTSNGQSDDTATERSGSTKPLMPIKSILKKTEVEQYSTRAGSDAGASSASYRTGSETSSGTYDKNGVWHASDTDTSALSEKEIKKLLKKGINPALYLEMKQARGKSRIGALTGNSFVG